MRVRQERIEETNENRIKFLSDQHRRQENVRERMGELVSVKRNMKKSISGELQSDLVGRYLYEKAQQEERTTRKEKIQGEQNNAIERKKKRDREKKETGKQMFMKKIADERDKMQ